MATLTQRLPTFRKAAARRGGLNERRSPVARYRVETRPELATAPLISQSAIRELEAELMGGASMAALQRFNAALRALDAATWRAHLLPVLAEFCFNLESFNPAFAHVILKVQSSIGSSDYLRRDAALKQLIVPLAGEYGMHNGAAQGKTHRQLFDEWVQSMVGVSASELVAGNPTPPHAAALFERMMRDISGGAADACPLTQAAYALGYNLAIEFMADYEKRWMLESFRELDGRFMATQGRTIDWLFLEVHAEDEMEHAAIGHAAVTQFVPAELTGTVRRAMLDHDRDFAAFYNAMAGLLEA